MIKQADAMKEYARMKFRFTKDSDLGILKSSEFIEKSILEDGDYYTSFNGKNKIILEVGLLGIRFCQKRKTWLAMRA